MAIASTRYVSIDSEVIGSTAVPTRQLIARIFSVNPLVPTGKVIQFTSADDVKTYFGEDAEEYKRAAFYFGWVSKKLTQPAKIGYYFWPQSDTAPLIYGAPGTYAYGNFTGITAGTFDLTIGDTTETVTIDWSTATDLATVASLLQTAIQTAGAADGTVWTDATVTYDATRGSFNFTGGATGANAISITDGTDTPAALLGWTSSAYTTLSAGVAAQEVADMLDASETVSNNFGSFFFTDDCSMTLTEVEAAAEWNSGKGILYMYPAGVTAANASTWSAALFSTVGVSLTLIDRTTYPDEYDEMAPGIILAATPYTKQYGVQNYMYQQFDDLDAKVTDTTTANTYDTLRVNYYGAIQQAGSVVGFYQRGTMMGSDDVPVDMNIYANEMWFKDQVNAALLNLLLDRSEIPTNNRGKTMIRAALQTCIDAALYCGAFQTGKTLTSAQKAAIASISDSDTAYQQVATNGYWLTISFESYTTDDDRTEWEAVYTLVYSKDDVVRKIIGTHALV